MATLEKHLEEKCEELSSINKELVEALENVQGCLMLIMARSEGTELSAYQTQYAINRNLLTKVKP